MKNWAPEPSGTTFVNYAHRGASEYAPENTLFAFNLGVYMGANGIETDVQLTRDGVAVLYHDATLERMTGQSGCIADYTYEELQAFRVTKNGFQDVIITLDEFLHYFHFRPITLAVELKSPGTAGIVAGILRKYDMAQKVVVTSFSREELVAFRAAAPEYQTGCLTGEVTEELLAFLKENGIVELCPRASLVSTALVEKWHSMGFRVRAWGVADTQLMKRAYDAGCDGMTVNFPDKLTEYMQKQD